MSFIIIIQFSSLCTVIINQTSGCSGSLNFYDQYSNYTTVGGNVVPVSVGIDYNARRQYRVSSPSCLYHGKFRECSMAGWAGQARPISAEVLNVVTVAPGQTRTAGVVLCLPARPEPLEVSDCCVIAELLPYKVN